MRPVGLVWSMSLWWWGAAKQVVLLGTSCNVDRRMWPCYPEGSFHEWQAPSVISLPYKDRCRLWHWTPGRPTSHRPFLRFPRILKRAIFLEPSEWMSREKHARGIKREKPAGIFAEGVREHLPEHQGLFPAELLYWGFSEVIHSKWKGNFQIFSNYTRYRVKINDILYNI